MLVLLRQQGIPMCRNIRIGKCRICCCFQLFKNDACLSLTLCTWLSCAHISSYYSYPPHATPSYYPPMPPNGSYPPHYPPPPGYPYMYGSAWPSGKYKKFCTFSAFGLSKSLTPCLCESFDTAYGAPPVYTPSYGAAHTEAPPAMRATSAASPQLHNHHHNTSSNMPQVSPVVSSSPAVSFTPIKLSATPEKLSWTPGGLCIDDC